MRELHKPIYLKGLDGRGGTLLQTKEVIDSEVWVNDGGLISYGTDNVDLFRQAGGYVGRILKGDRPADLPLQTPVKYPMIVNLKAAKAIGLTIPETFLVRADRVIE